jgi:hypothetical protein
MVLTPGMASVEVKVLETTDQEVTVTPVAKAFQLKNRLSRNCFALPSESLEFSSIDEEMPNGDSRPSRANPVLGSAVGITLNNSE